MTRPHRCIAFSRALVGIEARKVTIETHLQSGTPGFVLVGLPESALREARTRVHSAIQNSGFEYPSQRIVVNLAPADLAKEGTRYDLAIAMTVLAAVGVIPPAALARYEFLGELGLFGEIRSARGALCAALAASGSERLLIVPDSNLDECRALPDSAIGATSLSDVVRLVRDDIRPTRASKARPTTANKPTNAIIGQESAKRAMLVAAAGGHHALLIGPPGAGKSMLAEQLIDLLPMLPREQAMEVAAIYSAAGFECPPQQRPPLRAPHHSASAVALIGGGPQGLPGEITLSHCGVLFLDELPHFKPSVLDHLREPLQARRVHIARARYRLDYPAGFQLIAAMNPCPAGRSCDAQSCRCTPNQRDRYQARLSGPLLDRIDLHVRVPALPPHRLIEAPRDDLEERAQAAKVAREVQLERQGALNAAVPFSDLLRGLHASARDLLDQALERGQLTARSTHKMLRVARTTADLERSADIQRQHMAEALSYRALDWESGVRA